MLIVEGADCVGKTTLCRRLLESLPGHTYAHLSRLPDGFDRYWGYVDRSASWVVQDRFHLSEVVYASVRGDPTPLDPETYRLVDAYLASLGSLLVVVQAEDDLVRSRFDPEREMYDLAMTLDAARYFRTLSGFDAGGYKIRPDLEVYCDGGHQFPDEGDVGTILEAYGERRRALSRVASRRPARL